MKKAGNKTGGNSASQRSSVHNKVSVKQSSHSLSGQGLGSFYAAGPTHSLSPVQAKFTIGKANDPYEREADTVADHVVSGKQVPAITPVPASGLGSMAQMEPDTEAPDDEQAQMQSIQSRAEDETQDDTYLQACFIQQKLDASEADEEPLQNRLIQRQADEEPDEEPPQPRLIQREEDAVEAEEEPETQPQLIQRESDDEDEAQPGLIQRLCPECENELAGEQKGVVQTKVNFQEIPDVKKEAAEADVASETSEAEVKEAAQGEVDGPAVNEPSLEAYVPEEKEPPVQTKSNKSTHTVSKKTTAKTSGLQSMLSTSKGGGSPISPLLRADMEQNFGRDLSQVKIHTDGSSAQMNRQLQSRAFTHEKDIYFNGGEYQPESKSGKHLLAHELAHTVQQGAAGNAIQRFSAPEQSVATEPVAEKPDDGQEVEGRMNERIDNDPDIKDPDDLDEDEREQASSPDRGKVRQESSDISSSGESTPSIDRGAAAQEKTAAQKNEVDQQMQVQPEESTDEEAEGEATQAELSEADAAAQRAQEAEARAQSVEIPAEPQPFIQPVVDAPVDSAGEALPRNAQVDTQVRGLGYIGEMLRVKGYEMKRHAAEQEMGSCSMDAVVEREREDLANAREGTATIADHNEGRKEIAEQSRQAHGESVERQQFVAEKAPGLASKADEGQQQSGELASESQSKAAKSQSEIPDDPDARKDAEKQNGEMQSSAEGAQSMDQAITQTGERARQYEADASMASEQNQQSEAQISETEGIISEIDARVAEMQASNDASYEQIENASTGPELIRQNARQTDQSGDRLIAATIIMEQDLLALQQQYLADMAAIESREAAEERLQKEQEAAAQTQLSPEDQRLVELAGMSDEEQEQEIAGMGQSERDGLLATLERMIQAVPDQGADATEGSRNKVDTGLSQAIMGEQPQDPRQQEIQAVESRRGQRVGLVLDIADQNMTFLTAEQQRMLASRLVAESVRDDIANINVLQMGKQMIMAMIDPRQSLVGIVGGFEKMLGGFANIGNWEAWSRDPLGNLLQIAADISTGLAMVFSTILGIAGMIVALMVALTIITWGWASPVTAPVIGWMGTVMTYAGWGAIIAGSLSVYFNYLSYIKNLHDAGTAETARELFGNTEQMKQNASDGFQGAMAVVEGVGAVKMGPSLSSGEFFSNVPRSPGAFARQKLNGAREGLSSIASMPGQVGRGIQQLFRGGKQGLLRFKQRLKGLFGRRRTGVDIESPAPTRRQRNRLDETRNKPMRDMDEPQIRAEMDEVGRNRPKRLDDSSPYNRDYDIEIQSNGHTYRRRRDGKGWCRFSARECGIADTDLPDSARRQVNEIDSDVPATATRDSRSGRQQALDNDLPENPLPGYEWYSGPDGTPLVRRKQGHTGPQREYDANVPARRSDGTPTPLDERFPVRQTTRRTRLRDEYLGSTPGKRSKTGRNVIDRMRGQKRVRGMAPNEMVKVKGPPPPIRERWYPIDEMDMGHHPVDAVTYWNETGKKLGPRSSEVREWMLDPDNYELQHRSINRSEGAKLGQTAEGRYQPPDTD